MQQDDAAIRRLLAAEHGLQETSLRLFGCVYCGNQDLKKMKILEPEGEEAMRLDVCEECHAYLKTYQGCKQINQAAPDGPDECEEIYRHDWATLHLDLAGQEQGLVKRGSALLPSTPGPDEGEEK